MKTHLCIEKKQNIPVLARTDHLGERDLQRDQWCNDLKDTLLALSNTCQIQAITMQEKLPAIRVLADLVRWTQ
jgi:hypothetical protein